jgi:hypothetical protein
MKRGFAAMAESKRVAETAMNGGGPWRFYLKDDRLVDPNTKTEDNPAGIPNNESGIIILDNRIEDIPGFHEHNLKIGGKWGNFEICPQEWAHCPICEGGDRPYYACFFSVLVLRPWRSKDGKKDGLSTKMLLAVKSSQMGKMEEVLTAAVKRNGQLRGTFLYMKRDLGNKNAASIGEPSILDNGSLFDFYTEDELNESFGHDAERSPQGKVLKDENEDITPFNYDELFPKPDVTALRQRYGGRVQPGSREETEADWGSAEGSAGDDDLPGLKEGATGGGGRGKPQQRTAPARSGPAAPAEAPATTRGPSRRSAPPAATSGKDPFEEEES